MKIVDIYESLDQYGNLVKHVVFEDGTAIDIGGMNNVAVFGTDGNDSLYSGDNNDVIYGLGGDDTIDGSVGNDIIDGGSGADTISGGAGDDTVIYNLAENANNDPGLLDYYNGDRGSDTLTIDLNSAVIPVGMTSQQYADAITNYFNSYGNIVDFRNLTYVDPDSGQVINIGFDLKVKSFESIQVINIHPDVFSDNADTVNFETIATGQFDQWSYYNAMNGNDMVTLPSLAHVTSTLTDYDFGKTFFGGSGVDQIKGQDGNDIIDAGSGNDTLVGGAGNDVINGGDDVDTVNYATAAAGINVNLTTGVATDGLGGTDSLVNIENVISGGNHDTIIGNDQNNFILANSGNDYVDGGAGDDFIVGNQGNDTLDGNLGNDTLSYTSESSAVYVDLGAGIAYDSSNGTDQITNFEVVIGSNYNDTIIGSNQDDLLSGFLGDDLLIGGAGADSLYGFSGNDTVSYVTSSAGVNVNLGTGVTSGGDAVGDIFDSIENLTGSSFADQLTGDANNNIISGGSGDDILFTNAGNDVMDGGAGLDAMNYTPATSAINVNLSTGVAVDGLGGVDTVMNIENIIGTAMNDTIIGDDGNNYITANPGDDHVEGLGGDDFMLGNQGNDYLDGGMGYDTISYSITTPSGVYVNLSTGVAYDSFGGTDTIVNVEAVIGGNYDDTLIGDSQDNLLNGFLGNNTFAGGGGNDTLATIGAGDDTFIFAPGDGNDVINAFNLASPSTEADQIDLTAFNLINGFADLDIVDNNNGSFLIDLTPHDLTGDGTTILVNTSSLDADDFIF